MWSTLSEVQAYLQYFNDAADYARKMVDGYMWVKDTELFIVTHMSILHLSTFSVEKTK